MTKVLGRPSGALLIAIVVAMTVPSAPASHSDGFYDGPVWFEWNTKTLQVLVYPPESGQIRNNANGILNGLDVDEANPCTNSYTQALRDAIANWVYAIGAEAAAWLSGSFTLTTHFVGCDPPATLPTSPEIVVVTDLTKGPVLGVAISSRPCVINNSRVGGIQSFTYEDMFNVMGHEFAHCLGLGHTGDLNGGAAGDPSHPGHDIIEGIYEHSVGSAGVHLHCVSNLNVRVLEAVFDSTSNPSQIVTMATGDYEKIPSPYCNNDGEPVS